MSGDIDFWKKRYNQQVGWTLATRRYIFEKAGIRAAHRILEVGCGSGAVLESLKYDGYANTIGLDIDVQILCQTGLTNLINADVFKIPFSNKFFDISLCHFLLLWVSDPSMALKEMMRVTKPGGWVIALAEPDYGGRIDYPGELVNLGNAQRKALCFQGADVSAGRKLKNYFKDCGLKIVESGIIAAQWTNRFNQEEFEMEWSVLRKDIKGEIPSEVLARYYQIDLAASRQGKRVLFVPIFYAFGQMPE